MAVFAKKYGVHRLVHFELFADMASAIEREKVTKKWRRAWKLDSRPSAPSEWPKGNVAEDPSMVRRSAKPRARH